MIPDIEATPRSLTTVKCPADFHELRAGERPDGLCWIADDRTWTWAEAWDDIQRFAGALRAEGVTRGDHIAFVDRHSAMLLVAMHAVSLLGAANVVVDAQLTADETTYVLNHSSARVLFVRHDLVPSIQAIRNQLTSVEKVVVVGGPHDELSAWFAAADPVHRQADVTPYDACLVRYTSGTTGRPKGVVLTQHNLLEHTRNAMGPSQYDEGDTLLLSKLMFHSCALFGAASGAAAIVVNDVGPQSLTAALDAGLTHAFLHTASFVALQEAGPDVMRSLGRLASVTYGSIPIAVPVLQAALEAWPNTTFSQVYGMNEAVAALTTLDDAAHRDTSRPDRLASCGRPNPGVEMRVVDPRTGEDVEPETAGELWFRTEQTTPGYLASQEATAALLTADGWMRTGDVGRVDDGGFIFLEDRIKDVIKTGVWTVYSAEVERVLADHLDVLEQAVIGIPDERLGESVHAVVVFRPGRTVPADQLVAFARERLAWFKVPTSVTVVDALPRTASGKVLKRVLRAPYWADRERPI